MNDNYYFHTQYIIAISFVFFIIIVFSKIRKPQQDTMSNPNNWALYLMTVLTICYIGFRPIIGETGDTKNYWRYFVNSPHLDLKSDVVFYGLMKLFNLWGTGVYAFFVFVATVYIGSYMYFCKKYFGTNQIIVFFSILTSLSFFGLGINGIRNGMALAVFLFTFIAWQNDKKFFAAILALITINIHSSSLLPIASLLVVSYCKKTKWIYRFWLISLVLGIAFQNQTNVIFKYISLSSHDAEYFMHYRTDRTFAMSGFRYDFLLYGIVPIIISYYYLIKNGIEDEFYRRLSGVYVLCNAAWLYMASGWLSNRFAMLSWSIYVPVAIYPLVNYESEIKYKIRSWLFVLGNYVFTLLMFFLGKFR